MTTTGRVCSIADALAIMGDRWTLLAVREIVLGSHRFDEIAAGTGAARDVLTQRLRKLESLQLIERRRYQERPPRFEYLLTDAGAELIPPMLALMHFGDIRREGDLPVRWTHGPAEDAHDLVPSVVCETCGAPAHESLRDPRGVGAP